MAGLNIGAKLGVTGPQSQASAAMYGNGNGNGNGNGQPEAHVITGELLALVVLELILLGWLRLSFRHHFGG